MSKRDRQGKKIKVPVDSSNWWRFLEFHGMSTPMYFWTLARMSLRPDSRHGRMTTESEVPKVARTIGSLLDEIGKWWEKSGKNWVKVFLSEYRWNVPEPPDGNVPVNVSCKQCGLRLKDLTEALDVWPDRAMKKATVEFKQHVEANREEYIEWEDAFRILLKATKFHCVVFQICVGLSAPFDEKILGECYPDIQQHRSLVDVPKQLTQNKRTSPWGSSPNERLLVGLCCCQITILPAPRPHMSFAVDAARRGAKNRLYGFCCDDLNVGCWFNPTERF